MFKSSRDSMFFLPLMDIWLANEPSIQQAIPPTPQYKDFVLEEDDFPFQEIIEIKPFFLEGSVNDFDPAQRAVTLAKTLPKNLCGSYRSFDNDLKRKVKLMFSKVKPIGQMIELEGEMYFDNYQTEFTGILNAKSDQLEIIPLNNLESIGINSGGSFIGLQGTKLFTWKSSKLDQSGGRLELKADCGDNLSKSFDVRSVW